MKRRLLSGVLSGLCLALVLTALPASATPPKGPEAGRKGTEAAVKRMADVIEASLKGTYKAPEAK